MASPTQLPRSSLAGGSPPAGGVSARHCRSVHTSGTVVLVPPSRTLTPLVHWRRCTRVRRISVYRRSRSMIVPVPRTVDSLCRREAGRGARSGVAETDGPHSRPPPFRLDSGPHEPAKRPPGRARADLTRAGAALRNSQLNSYSIQFGNGTTDKRVYSGNPERKL
jgi:hypothetical protein